MQIHQAQKLRGAAWRGVARKAGASLVLLVAGLLTLAVSPGRSGGVPGVLLIAGALAVWLSAVALESVRSGSPRPRPKRVRSRGRKKISVVTQGGGDDPRIQPGDYFSTGRSLFRVEHLAGARVLVEDCGSGDLIDMDRDTCAALERIKRSAQP